MKIIKIEDLKDVYRTVDCLRYTDAEDLTWILRSHHEQITSHRVPCMITDNEGEENIDAKFFETCTSVWEEVIESEKKVIIFKEFAYVKENYESFKNWVNE